MALLCPQAPAAEVRYLFEPEEIAIGQGDAAIVIRNQFNSVYIQWNDRAQQFEIQDDELVPFRHVPFQMVGTRKVRYRYAGPLKPRRILSDDEDE